MLGGSLNLLPGSGIGQRSISVINTWTKFLDSSGLQLSVQDGEV
jgi:hypothetical protein